MIITAQSQQAFENYLRQFFSAQTPVQPTNIQLITSSNDVNTMIGTALGQEAYVGTAINLPTTNLGALFILNNGSSTIYQRFDDYATAIAWFRQSSNNGSSWSNWNNQTTVAQTVINNVQIGQNGFTSSISGLINNVNKTINASFSLAPSGSDPDMRVIQYPNSWQSLFTLADAPFSYLTYANIVNFGLGSSMIHVRLEAGGAYMRAIQTNMTYWSPDIFSGQRYPIVGRIN